MNFAKRFSYDMHEVTSTESALKRLSTRFEKDSDLKFLSGASVRSFLEAHCAVLVSAFKARPCHLLARKTSLSDLNSYFCCVSNLMQFWRIFAQLSSIIFRLSVEFLFTAVWQRTKSRRFSR
ncbi:hypothetical protein CDAR_98141 [Caerostris darwini]|uniref:Uncharacterized protein n=1 Tax=Caerostris darwini TaxID=1538125 RepID=A0AAV4UFT5_9ARAC|nr:hypothetical protein CDAR_98141 [Caerostris darwini]